MAPTNDDQKLSRGSGEDGTTDKTHTLGGNVTLDALPLREELRGETAYGFPAEFFTQR